MIWHSAPNLDTNFAASLTWLVVVSVSTLLGGFFSGSTQVEFRPKRKVLGTPDTLKEDAPPSVVLWRVFNLWGIFSVRLGSNYDGAFNLQSHVAEHIY